MIFWRKVENKSLSCNFSLNYKIYVIMLSMIPNPNNTGKIHNKVWNCCEKLPLPDCSSAPNKPVLSFVGTWILLSWSMTIMQMQRTPIRNLWRNKKILCVTACVSMMPYFVQFSGNAEYSLVQWELNYFTDHLVFICSPYINLHVFYQNNYSITAKDYAYPYAIREFFG